MESTLESAGGDAAAIIEVAQQAAAPQHLDEVLSGTEREGVEVYSVPNGVSLQTLDLEAKLEHPRRAAGTVKVGNVAALIGYVERHYQSGTTVWVDGTNERVVGVLNDHEAQTTLAVDDAKIVKSVKRGSPGWGDHRVELNLQRTPEWKLWASNDDKLLTQIEFAEHIEDGLLEIVSIEDDNGGRSPSATEMLAVAQHFSATRDHSFNSSHHLNNGQVQFKHHETIDAKAGNAGEFAVPKSFHLQIKPFIGEPAYIVTAHFRFRLNGGSLKLAYKLERPHNVLRDALEKIAERIDTAFPGSAFVGIPR